MSAQVAEREGVLQAIRYVVSYKSTDAVFGWAVSFTIEGFYGDPTLVYTYLFGVFRLCAISL